MRRMFSVGALLAALVLGNAGAQGASSVQSNGWSTVAQSSGAWGNLAQEAPSSEGQSTNTTTSVGPCLDPGTGAPAYCGCTWVTECHQKAPICQLVQGPCTATGLVCTATKNAGGSCIAWALVCVAYSSDLLCKDAGTYCEEVCR